MGSHILDSLHEHRLPAAVLLRSTSPTEFLSDHLANTDVRQGSIQDIKSLLQATTGVTHVIHCAGATKALRPSDFHNANHQGTLNLIQAVNQAPGVERFLHISSLAVTGPATATNPADEDWPPRPVSEYGRSKLAGEEAVRQQCRVPYTILRPPAVYGPRDKGFLSMFKAVKHHLRPRPSKTQALSLVYAKDLAEAVVACLLNPRTAGKTFFVASPEVTTGRKMADEIALQMNRWTVPCPMPAVGLWVVCLIQQCLSQVTRRAGLLNLQKYAELRAPGWVCNPGRLLRETGVSCRTPLSQGIGRTLEWYVRERWL